MAILDELLVTLLQRERPAEERLNDVLTALLAQMSRGRDVARDQSGKVIRGQENPDPVEGVLADARTLNALWEATGRVDPARLASIQRRMPEGYTMAEDYTLVPKSFYK